VFLVVVIHLRNDLRKIPPYRNILRSYELRQDSALIEQEYKRHFDNIVILCPTLRWNKTYLDRPWIFSDDYVFLEVPNGNLFQVIEKLSKMLSEEETLFIVDDVIANETLDKKRQPLLNLAISGRHTSKA